MSTGRIDFENSFGFCVNGANYRVKKATQVQNVFRHVVRRAEAMGMKVNTGKTDLMLVSDSTSYVADTFIEDSEGVHIATVDKLKVLGFRISNRPGVHAHACEEPPQANPSTVLGPKTSQGTRVYSD